MCVYLQSEQKKFLQQHKTRSETYSKAVATMKKQRKKSRGASKSGIAMDKELKNMQILEEEKSKLDAFCEQSLKNVRLRLSCISCILHLSLCLPRLALYLRYYYSWHFQPFTRLLSPLFL